MKYVAMFCATGAGSGFSPVAPGTAGSILAALLLAFCSTFSSWPFILITTLIVIVGIWASSQAEEIVKKEDPSIVVIDEIAGMLIGVLFLPPTLITILLTLVFFRVFDIAKPYPVRQAEEGGVHLAGKFPQFTWLSKNKGGIGIMLDDILAGIYTNIIVRIILHFIN